MKLAVLYKGLFPSFCASICMLRTQGLTKLKTGPPTKMHRCKIPYVVYVYEMKKISCKVYKEEKGSEVKIHLPIRVRLL